MRLATGEDRFRSRRLAKQAAVTGAATTFEAVAKVWHEAKRIAKHGATALQYAGSSLHGAALLNLPKCR